MGLFSDILGFHESGEPVKTMNTERFGEPSKSLYTSTELLTLHHRMEVTDDMGNVVYRVETQFPSIHDKTDITDSVGRHVAHIERVIFTLHERHHVTMADGTAFDLSNELFHIIKDITNIEGLGWQLRGNILALNFELYDENEEIIALISQKLLSIHDKYCIDIYQPQHEQVVVAILIALQHMVCDRESAASAPSGSSSSSSGN